MNTMSAAEAIVERADIAEEHGGLWFRDQSFSITRRRD